MPFLVLAYVAAAVSLVDLATGVIGGVGAIGAPLLGVVFGWWGLQRGEQRTASLTAIVANVAVLLLVVVAIFAFGGA